MSRIPDCRTDNTYNQKYLGEKDAEFLKGFDFALEEIRSLFYNWDVYFNEFEFDDEDINFARFLKKHPKINKQFEMSVCDQHEKSRDKLIVSMIDGMDETEYERIKKAVDSGNIEPNFKETEDEL